MTPASTSIITTDCTDLITLDSKQQSEKQECFSLLCATMREMFVDEAIRILKYIEFTGRVAVSVGWDYGSQKYTYKLKKVIEYLETLDASYPIRDIECVFAGGRPDKPRKPYRGTIADLLIDRLMCIVDERGTTFLIEVDNECYLGCAQ